MFFLCYVFIGTWIRLEIMSNSCSKMCLNQTRKLSLQPELSPCMLVAHAWFFSFSLGFCRFWGCEHNKLHDAIAPFSLLWDQLIPNLFLGCKIVHFLCTFHHLPSNFIRLTPYGLQSSLLNPNQLFNIYNLVPKFWKSLFSSIFVHFFLTSNHWVLPNKQNIKEIMS